MKRKKPKKAFPNGQRGWVGRLFRKSPKPIKLSRRARKAKAFAAANRRAWLGLAIALVVVAALFAMLLSVPPQIFPEQLADSVKAQRVHIKGELVQGSGKHPGSVELPSSWVETGKVFGTTPSNRLSTMHYPAPYLPISFESLSAFRFSVTDQIFDAKKDSFTASRMTMEQIPEEVRALSGHDVSLRGFMLPMKYEGKLATEFLLMRNQSLCCYGRPPKITEWVKVRVTGKGVKPIMDEPVTVCGTFHVGDLRENGELLGIYRLDAEKLKGPRE